MLSKSAPIRKLGRIIPGSLLFRINLVASLFTLLLLIWFASGTLAPYSATSASPLVLGPCHYAYNGDHDHFKATFHLLNGAPREQWEFSVVLRRILYPIAAYPWMKLWGFEIGGFAFNLFLSGLAFLFFGLFLRKATDEEGSIPVLWLLATYPGTLYWSGMPYSYAAIVPVSLFSMILLHKFTQAKSLLEIAWLSLLLGIFLTAYDLFPFFGCAATWILLRKKQGRWLPMSLILILLPQALVLGWLKEFKDLSALNGNTSTYAAIVSAWLHPDWSNWVPYIQQFPGNLWRVYLISNFTYLPFFLILFSGILLLFRQRGRQKQKWRIGLPEEALLLSGLLLFTFNNLSPPYPGWQLRGEFIARLYQPLIAAYLLLLARNFSLLTGLTWTPIGNRYGKSLVYVLYSLVIAQQVWIGVGPIAGYPETASLHHHLFYQHWTRDGMTRNLEWLGRRPVGFCGSSQ